MKVGTSLDDDIRRSNSMRKYIGENSVLVSSRKLIFTIIKKIHYI